MRKVAQASNRQTQALQLTFCNHVHILHICWYICNFRNFCNPQMKNLTTRNFQILSKNLTFPVLQRQFFKSSSKLVVSVEFLGFKNHGQYLRFWHFCTFRISSAKFITTQGGVIFGSGNLEKIPFLREVNFDVPKLHIFALKNGSFLEHLRGLQFFVKWRVGNILEEKTTFLDVNSVLSERLCLQSLDSSYLLCLCFPKN